MSSTNNDNYLKNSSMPWLGTKQIDEPKVSNINKENLIFKMCADITDDPYWKSIFIEAYNGKLPKGIHYKDGNLSYKNKEVRISDITEEAYIIILTFLKKEYGIKSPMDVEREKFQEKEEQQRYICKKSWSEYKSKSIKELLITDYILHIKDTYKLNKDEYNQLCTLINISINEGKIIGENILLIDGHISNITNLCIENNKFMVIPNKKKRKCAKNINNNYIDDDDVDDDNINKQSIKTWNTYLKSFSSTIPYKTKIKNTVNNTNNNVSQTISQSLLSNDDIKSIESSSSVY